MIPSISLAQDGGNSFSHCFAQALELEHLRKWGTRKTRVRRNGERPGCDRGLYRSLWVKDRWYRAYGIGLDSPKDRLGSRLVVETAGRHPFLLHNLLLLLMTYAFKS